MAVTIKSKKGKGLATRRDVARLLSVHPNTVRNLMKRGLPYLRLSPHTHRFDMQAVAGWIANQGQPISPAAPAKRNPGAPHSTSGQGTISQAVPTGTTPGCLGQ